MTDTDVDSKYTQGQAGGYQYEILNVGKFVS